MGPCTHVLGANVALQVGGVGEHFVAVLAGELSVGVVGQLERKREVTVSWCFN